MKKLKLRIAKFDRMLVVEQLERTGEWRNSEHVYVQGKLSIFRERIDLSEEGCRRADSIEIFDNAESDKYVQKLVKWITEEQFGDAMKLEIGKMCKFSNDGKEWVNRIYAGKSFKQLGEEKRFLAVNFLNNDALNRWKYAKPINDCLKVDGEIYTWETEE